MKFSEFTYFYPERPRLLHIEQPLFERLSQDPLWVAEPKYNGSRLQLHYVGGAWQFWNRHGQPLDYRPSPEVMAALDGLDLKGYWLFDGELRHRKVKGVQHKIVLYDVFAGEGELLLNAAFQDRRHLLACVLRPHLLAHGGEPDASALGMPCQYHDNFREFFLKLTQDEEIEGLVLKDLRGRLNLGRNRAAESAWMWKVRRPSGSYQF
jgi:ATP-dependent DNA ligase